MATYNDGRRSALYGFVDFEDLQERISKMLLRDKWWPNDTYEIDTAFIRAYAERDGGYVECADANAERALQKIGDLISLLYAKGLLNDEDVIGFLGERRWERAE